MSLAMAGGPLAVGSGGGCCGSGRVDGGGGGGNFVSGRGISLDSL